MSDLYLSTWAINVYFGKDNTRPGKKWQITHRLKNGRGHIRDKWDVAESLGHELCASRLIHLIFQKWHLNCGDSV